MRIMFLCHEFVNQEGFHTVLILHDYPNYKVFVYCLITVIIIFARCFHNCPGNCFLIIIFSFSLEYKDSYRGQQLKA